MTEALMRKVAHPGRYLRLIPKLALQTVAPLFRRTSFRLEGQMDINPLSRWHDAGFRRSMRRISAARCRIAQDRGYRPLGQCPQRYVGAAAP